MDEYNTLIICLTIICIFLLVIIISTKKNKEHFNSQTIQNQLKCSYEFNPNHGKAECMESCLKYANDKAKTDEKVDCQNFDSETGCVQMCNKQIEDLCVVDNKDEDGEPFTKCIINPYLDISGNTIQQCITRCAQNTKNCKGCKDFHFKNTFDSRIAKGTYTNNLDHFLNRCSPEAEDQQFCSPCVKACKECNDANLCRWLKKDDPTQHIDFLKDFFTIGIIPGDKSLTIVWDELRSDVSKYLFFIYKKSDVNTSKLNVQQTPITVKTIERDFTNVGTNHQQIDGLLNGVTYSITVNKVSTHMESVSGEKIVKSSNTIDVVPSTVPLVDFSKLSKDGVKQEQVLSHSFMNSIKGKTLDITI
jgi:hypothetical protein